MVILGPPTINKHRGFATIVKLSLLLLLLICSMYELLKERAIFIF